eukprot:6819987-Alexandrium_andersonii.AAC.2
MRCSPPAAPVPRACLPPRVQAPAHVVRPRAVMHLLTELVAIAPTGLTKKPLERCPAVVAHEVLREELSGTLRQPEHDVVYRDLPLGPLLERQHPSANQPLELPRRLLGGTVGLRLVRGRRLEHSLCPHTLGDRLAQVDQRGLIVGLEQDPLAVSEPTNARHR